MSIRFEANTILVEIRQFKILYTINSFVRYFFFDPTEYRTANPILKPIFKTFVIPFKRSRIGFSWRDPIWIVHAIPLIDSRPSGNMEFANRTIIVSREPVANSAIKINSHAHL